MANVKVGWIGIGVMGRSMCGHLLRAGYTVTLYTRSRDKAADLLASGASWQSCPRDVAERSNVVFTMVGFPTDVEQVYLAADGILAGAKSGSTVCDMTTSE
ncbi:MAG TPA: NAD(P)-binding domain-containing protein, partial [Spirochaetia bacterium]|nr:NAD(P)-binding domain-containing protein [Spirochaetia bacterium]